MTRILLCKVGGLGDSLSALPALAALRASRPDCALTVLCSPIGAEVFAAVPDVRMVVEDRASLSGPAGLSRVPALARELGRQDVALLSFDECTAVYVTARVISRRRIGFDAGIARGQGLLNEALPFDAAVSPYRQALELVRGLCAPSPALRRVPPVADVPAHWLARRRIDGAYGILHAGAATELQRWGLDRFKATAWLLSECTGIPWLIVDASAGLSLSQLAGLIGGAQGFVGNHSGPLHLAAALGVPWVGVAGPSARAWDPPWHDVPGRILRGDLDCVACGALGAPVRVCPRNTPRACLDALTPRAVAGAMREVLESSAACPPNRPA